MKKQEFLEMMWQDNETESEPQKTLYADVIECMDISLSQTSDTFEVQSDKTVKGAYELIEKRGRENKKDSVGCVGLFEAAEILAKYLGTNYERPSKLFAAKPSKVNLDDLLD